MFVTDRGGWSSVSRWECVDEHRYKRMLVHSIRDDAEMGRYGAESKFDRSWKFLTRLRDAGLAATSAYAPQSISRPLTCENLS